MAEQDLLIANQNNQNGQLQAIRDYIRLVVNENYSDIARPAIASNKFELKPGLVHMVQQNQFGGAPTKDPNAHLGSFLEICDTVKMNRVTENAIQLRLFSFCLRDKAKACFQSLPYGSITTFEGLAQKFFTKFFPPSKAAQLRDWLQIQTFYNGLNGQTQIVVDFTAGGALLSKTPDEVYALLDEIATNSYQWPSERLSVEKVAGLYEVDPITALTAQMSSLTNHIATLTSRGSQKKSKSVLATSTTYQKAEKENEQLQSRFNKDEVRLDNIETHISNLRATVKNLEVQIEVNPREHYNAIILRNGKVVEECKLGEVVVPKSDLILAGEKQTVEQKTKAETKKKMYKPYSISFPDNPLILKPPLPFPQRYLKKEFDEKFAKLLEVFKKIHINILFVEALAQMPNYAKFLKEVISKKRKLGEFESVKLTEECSTILQKKLPHKLKDPGSFNIPCNIGGITFDMALCDLGASINLMPLSVFKKLGFGEVKPTTLTLQLRDRSITYPKGIIEDVLVKVDKFIFPVDFVVLDMEEDEKVLLILGQPFLTIGRALIDVQEGKLTLRVN
ncbi:uncharacterized protein LOC111408340 [Olea europaea var. sylvestris]|uniref:uncharacterized protein LOC111408340 n=1 Tax=Olea europaea var. sylvestris TaxID=158386 RepID=UPI000C1D5081|nr:uncharacterized protein LOC111408340 [Olea europaea var. sylvestris]